MSAATEPRPMPLDASRTPPPDPWRWKSVPGADLATTFRTGKACFQFIFDYKTRLKPTPQEQPTFQFLTDFFQAVSTGVNRPISSSELASALQFLQAVRVTEQTELEPKLKQKGKRLQSGTTDVLDMLLTLIDRSSPDFKKEINDRLGLPEKEDELPGPVPNPWRWIEPTPDMDDAAIGTVDALCEQQLYHRDLGRTPTTPDEKALQKILEVIFPGEDQKPKPEITVQDIAIAMRLLRNTQLSAQKFTSEGKHCSTPVTNATLDGLYTVMNSQPEDIQKQLDAELGHPGKTDQPGETDQPKAQ